MTIICSLPAVFRSRNMLKETEIGIHYQSFYISISNNPCSSVNSYVLSFMQLTCKGLVHKSIKPFMICVTRKI